MLETQGTEKALDEADLREVLERIALISEVCAITVAEGVANPTTTVGLMDCIGQLTDRAKSS